MTRSAVHGVIVTCLVLLAGCGGSVQGNIEMPTPIVEDRVSATPASGETTPNETAPEPDSTSTGEPDQAGEEAQEEADDGEQTGQQADHSDADSNTDPDGESDHDDVWGLKFTNFLTSFYCSQAP